MQTKHLYVLIHIRTKGEVGAPFNWFKPSSKIFLWTKQDRNNINDPKKKHRLETVRPFQGGASIVDHICYSCLFVMLSCTSVCLCHVVTCWERADLFALVSNV